MSKVSLTNLVNLQNETTAVNAINANNAVLTTALDNTLSRDGTSPNTMGSSLDMNSNRIINLPNAVSTTEPVSLSQMTAALVAGGNINTGITGVPVSAAMQPVVNAVSIPAAVTLMGIPPVSTAMQPVVNAATISQANFLLGNGNPVANSFSPQQYDILAGTAAHDSTAAINSAIAACPSGGTVHIPATASGYLISGTFLITKPISIIGDGVGTFFTGTLSSTTDLFNVTVPGASIIRGVRFSNFQIQITGGKNWFNLDTTAVGAFLAEVEIDHIYALSGSTAPTRSCILVNSAALATSGVFDLSFHHNQFQVNSGFSCIEFINAGDSIRVRDSLLTGTGFGILGSQVTGATNLIIDGLNCTCTGGVSLTTCIKPIIRNFEIEFSGSFLTGAAIILNGTTEGNIGPGSISALATSTGFSECVFLSNTTNIELNGLTLSTGVGGLGIVSAASTSGTIFGAANTFSGFGTNVSNLGTASRTISFT